jgi:hypothetical protein
MVGRIGKLMEFAVGLAAVLDLVGAAKLRRIGAHSTGVRKAAGRRILEHSEQENTRGAGAFSVFSAFATVVAGIVGAIAWISPRSPAGGLLLLSVTVVPIAIYLLIIYRREIPHLARFAFAGLLGLVADLILRPIAFLLDNANPGHLIRWAAFVLSFRASRLIF